MALEGGGRINTGNRTVTTVTLSLPVFPLLERGNAVRFSFCVFVSGSVCFCRYFIVFF